MAIPFLNTTSFSADVTVATALTVGGKVMLGTGTPVRKLELRNITGAINFGIGFNDKDGTTQGTIALNHNTNDLISASTANMRFFSGSVIGGIATLPTNQTLILTSSQNARFTSEMNANVVISRDNMFVGAGQFYIGAEASNVDNTFRQLVSSGAFKLQKRISGTFTNVLDFDSSEIGTFSNVPNVGTMAAGDNTIKAASTEFVTAAVTAGGGSGVFLPLAGGTMDTGSTVSNLKILSLTGSLPKILFNDSDGTNQIAEITASNGNMFFESRDGNNYGSFSFVRTNSTGSLTVMDIPADGDVRFFNSIQASGYIKHLGNADTAFGFPADDTIAFDTDNSERMRITSTGAISFGSTGTAYGTSGQVLTSAGNATPTWTTIGGGTGTVTGITEGPGIKVTASATSPTVAVDYAGADSLVMEAADAVPDLDDYIIFGADSSGGGDTNKIQFTDVNLSLFNNDVPFAPATGGSYLPLAGGTMTGTNGVIFPDNFNLKIGTGSDLKILHNATDSFIINEVGDLKITQGANDKDIIFESDNGSGGTTPYFKVDGQYAANIFSRRVSLLDNVSLGFGSVSPDGDLNIIHNGTDSIIKNITGNLYIKNLADNKDIIFQNDDGAGGVETYFFLDGSISSGSPVTTFPDNSQLMFGDALNLRVSTVGGDSSIAQHSGNLFIQQFDDNKDIRFQADNGSGGTTTYLTIDGLNENITFSKPAAFLDGVKATFGNSSDLQISHDGSESLISNSTGALVINSLGIDTDINFYATNTTTGNELYFQLDGSIAKNEFYKAAYFKDNIKAEWGTDSDLQIYHDGSNSFIKDAGTGALFVETDFYRLVTPSAAQSMISANSGGSVTLYNAGSQKFITTATGVTITGTATATTFLGDLNGTINTATTAVTQANAIDNTTVATTAYVNNKIATIPAGLVFQGTWNASTNTPTLASGTGTTGHFYIVSVSGSTNLDGITDWVTGDWAVFIEQGASDQWEKIDNSSVLDGIGTGQQVTKWSGSGTSNTLADGPIRFASNDSTFAGEVAIATGNDLRLYRSDNATYARFNYAGASVGLDIDDLNGDGINLQQAGVNKLRIETNGNATFAGNVTVGNNGNINIPTAASGNANLNFDGTDFKITSNSSSANLKLETNSTTRLTINSSGNATFTGNIEVNAQILTPGGSNLALNPNTGLVTIGGVLQASGTGASYFTGNLGIGTTSPGRKLSVLDATPIISSSDGTTEALFYANGGLARFGAGSNAPISFQINGSEKVRIDTSGNVGIGTTGPTEKLDVNGNVKADSYGTDEAVTARIFSPAGAAYNGSGSQTGYLILKLPDNAAAGVNNMMSGVIRVFDYAFNQSFDVHFAGYWYTGFNWTNCTAWIDSVAQVDRNYSVRFGVMNGGSGNADRPFITIGEGDSTWDYCKFSLVEYTSGHSNAQLEKWNSGWNVNLSATFPGTVAVIITNNQVNNWKRSGQDAYYGATGNVGIGTDSPDRLLEVAKEATSGIAIIGVKGGTSGAGVIQISGNGNAYDTNSFDLIQNSAGAFVYNRHNSPMVFATSNIERMRILANGNVGIGTTSPATKLHVFTTAVSANVIKVDNGTQNINLGVNNGSQGAFLFVDSNHGLRFGTNASERARFDANGNFGIGTTAPTQKLHVIGNVEVSATKAYIASYDNTTNYIGTMRWAGLQFGNNGVNRIVGGRTNTGGSLQFWTNNTNDASDHTVTPNGIMTMSMLNTGNVGIGTTAPTERLEIIGNSLTRGKTRGIATNYATSEGWIEATAGSFNSQTGYFGGNFTRNGAAAENKMEYALGPFGAQELVWMTIAETGNNDDGGWNKSLDGFANTAKNGFMSIVYMRRDSGTAAGNFYHGCSGSATNNLDGTANTNPYFCAFGIGVLPADVWCVSIGIIYAADDASTATSALGGSYRLDTGAKIHNAPTYRQKPGNSTQAQRVYHYYSTSPSAQLDFARPAWYVVDGTEPTLSEITAGAAGGSDDVFWTANGNDIYNDNSGSVGIGTTSPNAKLDVNGVVTFSANTDGKNTFQFTTGAAVDDARLLMRSVDTVKVDIQANGLTYFSGGNLSIGGTSQYSGTGVRSLNIEGNYPLIAFYQTGGNLQSSIISYYNNTQFVHSSSAATFQFSNGTGDLVKILANGVVGIKIEPKTWSTDALQLGANLTMSEDVNSVYWGANAYNNSGWKRINSQSAGYMRMGTNDGIWSFSNAATGAVDSGIVWNERMRVDTNGRVGIGTTSPDASLEIVQPNSTGGTGVPALILSNDSAGQTGYTWQSWRYNESNTNYRLDLKQRVTGGIVQYSFNMVNNGTGFDDVLVLDRGKVGIGTTFPNEKLQVTGNIHAWDPASIGNTNAGLFASTASGSTTVAVRSVGITHFNGGNVGIGTTGPTEKLTIFGGFGSPATSGTGANGNLAIESSNGNSLYIGSYSASPYGCWLQASNYADQGITYPIILNPNGGNVGIGTNTPGFSLEVLNASAEIALNASGGSIYRLKSDSTDSFRINKNGVGDRLVIAGNGTATFAGSINTSGSINLTNAGVNTIAANNPSGGFLKFLVDQQGIALTLNADATATFGNGGVGDVYLGSYAGTNHFRFHTNNANTFFDMNCGNVNWRQGSSTRYTFFPSTANMTVQGTITQNSDIRIKENVIEIGDCISKVQAMRGVYYNRTDFNTEVTKVGVIAQEVEAVLPELILESPEDGLKSVAYSELTAVLINAIKEQQQIIEDLKTRITKLEN